MENDRVIWQRLGEDTWRGEDNIEKMAWSDNFTSFARYTFLAAEMCLVNIRGEITCIHSYMLYF